MYTKLQFLEGMARRNKEEIHERRTLLNSIYAMKNELPGTGSGQHESMISTAVGSTARDMSSAEQTFRTGSLDQSASCPLLGTVQMETDGGTQMRFRRPAERAGFASPPGTPINRKYRRVVMAVSKNADEIASRRAFINSIKPKDPDDEDPALGSVYASGASLRPGQAAGRRNQPRRKQPIHTALDSYCQPMKQPASVHKAYPPAMPCSEGLSMSSRFEILNERVMWNAKKLSEHRTFLDGYLQL
mmetsp:Transcript_11416/g.21637  ORF Transcript_11416/g.21637 Transcript_11416/m.21637 type:complete len:245 (-) Transcript_11416:40-774(-)